MPPPVPVPAYIKSVGPHNDKKLRPFNLPAESIRHGWVESSLGLHLFSVGMVFEGLFVLALFLASLFVLIQPMSNSKLGLSRYCCYPEDIRDGDLGECSDPKAAIHLTPGVLECPKVSILWLRLVFTSIYLLLGNRFLIFVWDLPFESRVEEMLSNAHDYDSIPRIQWYFATYSFGAFFFGTHNYILKRKAIKTAHMYCGVLAIIFTLFFVYIAMRLDAAWYCYGYANANYVRHGMCDDPTSAVYTMKEFSKDKTKHTPVFWWSLGFMCSFYFLFCVFYLISVTNLKDIFHYRALSYYQESVQAELLEEEYDGE